MYVAHTGADRIDVLDCKLGAYLRALPDHPGVAGILIDTKRDLLLATDRGAGRLSVYRCSDETLLGRVPVGPHPNGVALDTRRRHAYTFDLGEPLGTSCTATVVDLASRAVLESIPLPGRPRWALFDRSSDAVYANIADPPLILAIDAGTRMPSRRITVPAAGPHGLALVDATLYCAADGGELLAIERDEGRVRARAPLAGVPDVVMHDPVLGRVYVAIGAPGVVQSFEANGLRCLETVATE
jgi:DNA-binding beta-propeller fold protein YncE